MLRNQRSPLSPRRAEHYFWLKLARRQPKNRILFGIRPGTVFVVDPSNCRLCVGSSMTIENRITLIGSWLRFILCMCIRMTAQMNLIKNQKQTRYLRIIIIILCIRVWNRTQKKPFLKRWNGNFLTILEPEPNWTQYLNILKFGPDISSKIILGL